MVKKKTFFEVIHREENLLSFFQNLTKRVSKKNLLDSKEIWNAICRNLSLKSRFISKSLLEKKTLESTFFTPLFNGLNREKKNYTQGIKNWICQKYIKQNPKKIMLKFNTESRTRVKLLKRKKNKKNLTFSVKSLNRKIFLRIFFIDSKLSGFFRTYWVSEKETYWRKILWLVNPSLKGFTEKDLEKPHFSEPFFSAKNFEESIKLGLQIKINIGRPRPTQS